MKFIIYLSIALTLIVGPRKVFPQDGGVIENRVSTLLYIAEYDRPWALISERIQDTYRTQATPRGCTTLDKQEAKPEQIARSIVYFSIKYKVPINLVVALAEKESEYLQCTKRRKDAIGIMQIKPTLSISIQKDMGEPLLVNNVEDNLKMGIYQIAKLYKQFNGDEEKTIKAYLISKIKYKKLKNQKKIPKYVELYYKDISILQMKLKELGLK